MERYLLSDKYEEAINIILKLRDVYSNKSFQSYSANAIILTCLVNQRADIVMRFMESLDKEYEFNFSDNLFLLCKYCMGLSLNAKDIMRLAKSFEFTKTNYIKNYPDIFFEVLSKHIREKYNQNEIPCEKMITNAEFRKLPKHSVPIFANISIEDKSIEVPQLLTSFKFKKDVYFMLEKTHEEVKQILAEMRKTNSVTMKKAESKAKPFEISSFDTGQEKLLLTNYNKTVEGPLERHFVLINLQDFYYKYRVLDEKYLELCIKYCVEDITNLEQMQKNYYKEKETEIENKYYFSRTQKQKEIDKLTKFNGQIPAFKRLAIIYEKNNEYDSAISICEQAINYYSSVELFTQASEFNDRKEKLITKKSKNN